IFFDERERRWRRARGVLALAAMLATALLSIFAFAVFEGPELPAGGPEGDRAGACGLFAGKHSRGAPVDWPGARRNAPQGRHLPRPAAPLGGHRHALRGVAGARTSRAATARAGARGAPARPRAPAADGAPRHGPGVRLRRARPGLRRDRAHELRSTLGALHSRSDRRTTLVRG